MDKPLLDMTMREVMKLLEKPVGKSGKQQLEIQLSHDEIALVRHVRHSSESDIGRYKRQTFDQVLKSLLDHPSLSE